MSKSKLAAVIAGAVAVACIAFVVFLFGIKALWAWTVPDLFPGAVKQGLVAETISWGAAAKLAILLSLLAGLGTGGHARSSGRETSKAE